MYEVANFIEVSPSAFYAVFPRLLPWKKDGCSVRGYVIHVSIQQGQRMYLVGGGDFRQSVWLDQGEIKGVAEA